jgi:hypothetical protein
MLSRAVVYFVVCLGPGQAEEKEPAPLYTNADLARVRPYRDQTGVASTPAATPEPARDSAAAEKKGRGEAYWRRETERLADRVRPLRSQVTELRRRIDERWGKPGVRSLSDPRIQAWERDLAATEALIRELESRLLDRARREGALPGWLR